MHRRHSGRIGGNRRSGGNRRCDVDYFAGGAEPVAPNISSADEL